MVTAIVGLGLGLSSAGADLERNLAVWRARLHPRTATGQIVLVEIDARSLAKLRYWPWPRPVYVNAIRILEKARAHVIGFDVDFSAPSNPAGDIALARAISASKVPVILPTFRQAASRIAPGTIENLPLAMLRQHAQLAAVNIFAEPDGLVRSYPYAVMTDGLPRPSIGAMLTGASGRAGTAFPIDLSVDPATIPHVSFVDLIEGRVPASVLRGRGVLIGASAIELGDFYPVPGKGMLPGAVVQLLAAETLLQQSAPFSFGFMPPLLLALYLIVRGAGATGRRRLIVVALGVATIIIVPILLEIAKLGTLDVIPALGALLGGAIVAMLCDALAAAREARLTDPETGLSNGRALRAVLEEGPEPAVIVLRLVTYGDVSGVLGLGHAAEFVLRIAERVALASGGPVYRVEESALAWTVALPDPEEQTQRIEAAAALLRLPIEVGGRRIEPGHAFGIAQGGGSGAITRAIHAADRAAARSLRWVRHTDDLGRENAWRLGLAQELDNAMAAGAVWVAYQPKYDIRAGRITACEALVRWRHPELGAIPPDAFIPVLEESGRIADLTLYVLERTLADRRAWAETGVTLGVAVNVSALLPTDREFVARLETLLVRYADGVPYLTMEVTESATMADSDAAILALERLAAIGICLSIDDYGTGQSTLSYLKRLPAREIKIDKGFVMSIESNRSDQAMVRSTIELAHELGFKVVAEGVETAAALQILTAYGCDVAQGWHIGRPMPANALATAVTTQWEQAA